METMNGRSARSCHSKTLFEMKLATTILTKNNLTNF